MIKKMQVDTRLANRIVEHIHDENLPITIDLGRIDAEGYRTIIVECEDHDSDVFYNLYKTATDEIIDELYEEQISLVD